MYAKTLRRQIELLRAIQRADDSGYRFLLGELHWQDGWVGSRFTELFDHCPEPRDSTRHCRDLTRAEADGLVEFAQAYREDCYRSYVRLTEAGKAKLESLAEEAA